MRGRFKQGLVLFSILLLPFLLYFSLVLLSKTAHLITTLPVIDSNPRLQLSGGEFSEANLRNKVSVLVFNGDMDAQNSAVITRLYEKTYHPYRLMEDLQLVSFVTSDSAKSRLERALLTLNGKKPENWKICVKPCAQIARALSSLQPALRANPGCGSYYVLLLDKDLALRGRLKDPKYGSLHAYDASNASMLNSELQDDIRILLAEYRLERKKNNKYKLKKS